MAVLDVILAQTLVEDAVMGPGVVGDCANRYSTRSPLAPQVDEAITLIRLSAFDKKPLLMVTTMLLVPCPLIIEIVGGAVHVKLVALGSVGTL